MERRPAAMFGRAMASLALLLFAAMALASGLDRMSLQARGASRLIPPVLRAHSARSAAALAITRRQPAQAIASARAAVASDPMDPASSPLLGAAYLLNGDTVRAEAAYRVAARFGWREPSTQLYWYEASMQSGDMPHAVDRIDALLRTRPGFPQSELLLAPLESSPAGRAALIRRLKDRPNWLTIYLQSYKYGDDVLDRRAVVLTELAAAGTRLGCEAVTPFVDNALERGARRQAESVWLAHCPGASLTEGLADGGFEQFGRVEQSPFGWRPELSGDVTVRAVDKGRGNRVLALRNRGAVSRLVLHQAVSLVPGLYRLSGEVAPGHVSASLGCGGPPGLPRLVEGDIGAGGQLLRVERCSRLELGLWLRPGSDDVELDALQLRKVG
jgi:hypothetical protein